MLAEAGDKDADLMFSTPPVVPEYCRDAHQVRALLEKTGLIEHQNAAVIPQRGQHLGPHQITQRVRPPGTAAQQGLQPMGP